MKTVDRINIAAESRRIKREGYHESTLGTLLLLTRLESFSRIWHKVRPEIYKISGVMTHLIHERLMLEKPLRPPYGLLEMPGQDGPIALLSKTVAQVPVNNTFNYMHDAFSATFMKATEDELRYLMDLSLTEDELLHPKISVYKRYVEITKAWGNYARTQIDPNKIPIDSEPFIFIMRGFNVSEIVMSGILELIPKLVTNSSPQQLTEIAENSYPLIVYLASQNVEVIQPILELLKRDKMQKAFAPNFFNPDLFTIKKAVNGIRLDFSDEAYIQIDALITEIIGHLSDKTTIGCIALVEIEGNSLIKDLWKHHLEIAPDVYMNYLNGLL